MMPATRASTSKNSTPEPPTITGTSMLSPRAASSASTPGAIREAAASNPRRRHVSLVSGWSTVSEKLAIEGCRAATPKST
jgi:hypothetical protein